MKTVDKDLGYYTALFVTVQVADGICTVSGIKYFGLQAEGNAILRSAVENYGCMPAIITAKLLAILAILGLVKISKHVSWAKNMLISLCFLYIFVAIIPWVYYLQSYLVR